MLGHWIAYRSDILHWKEYGVLVKMVHGTSPKMQYIIIYIEVRFVVNNLSHVIAHPLE